MNIDELLKKNGNSFQSDEIDLEKILKKKYKIYIPFAIGFFVLFLVIFSVGVIGICEHGVFDIVELNGPKRHTMYSMPLSVLIFSVIFLAIAAIMAFAMHKKMVPVKQFILRHNMREINRDLNSSDSYDNVYPDLSLYVTKQLLISAENLTAVWIDDVLAIKISINQLSNTLTSEEIDMMGIYARVKGGQLVCLYKRNRRINDIQTAWQDCSFRDGLTDEMIRFEKKIRCDFPDIEVVSDVDY